MRVAIYARVSTSDKEQDPETQLMALRDYCEAKDWDISGEYIDKASARDLNHRTEWRRLLNDTAKRKFSAVLVFKLDRAFRSVKDLHDTLTAWELTNVSFLSIREGFDTTTPIGRLLMNLRTRGAAAASASHHTPSQPTRHPASFGASAGHAEPSSNNPTRTANARGGTSPSGTEGTARAGTATSDSNWVGSDAAGTPLTA